MKINELKKSFTQMSLTEQIDLLREIRLSRGQSKSSKPKAERKKKQAKRKSVNTLKNLTPEQIELLKQILKEEGL